MTESLKNSKSPNPGVNDNDVIEWELTCDVLENLIKRAYPGANVKIECEITKEIEGRYNVIPAQGKTEANPSSEVTQAVPKP